jgi:hypothetical protein
MNRVVEKDILFVNFLYSKDISKIVVSEVNGPKGARAEHLVSIDLVLPHLLGEGLALLRESINVVLLILERGWLLGDLLGFLTDGEVVGIKVFADVGVVVDSMTELTLE